MVAVALLWSQTRNVTIICFACRAATDDDDRLLTNFHSFCCQVLLNRPINCIAEEIFVLHWERRWYCAHRHPLFSWFPLQFPIITSTSITGGNFRCVVMAMELLFMFMFLSMSVNFYLQRWRSRPLPAAEVSLEGSLGIILSTLGLLRRPPTCLPRLSRRIFLHQVQVQIRSVPFSCFNFFLLIACGEWLWAWFRMTKNEEAQRPGPDPKMLLKRFWKVAAPYWFSDDKVQARWQLAAVFALTLGTTGISVGFNFLGRDFYNALASNSSILLPSYNR